MMTSENALLSLKITACITSSWLRLGPCEKKWADPCALWGNLFAGSVQLGHCRDSGSFRNKTSPGKKENPPAVGSQCPLFPIHVHLEPQNATWFENRVFADGIKGRIQLRSSWIRVGPKPNDSVLKRDRKGHTDTETKAHEDRLKQRQELGCHHQGMPGTTRNQKRQRRILP